MHEQSGGSVTEWIRHLKAGQTDAQRKLWDRYFESLVRIAAAQIKGAPRGVADEEDLALSAFHSLCGRAREGKLREIHDRDDLWRLLVVLSRQKSIDHWRTQLRQKRGGGLVMSGAAPTGDDSSMGGGLDDFLNAGPRPDEVAMIREELSLMIQELPDQTLRTIAVGKLEGHTNEELAQNLSVNPRTIERKLQLIRSLWLARLKSPA